MASKFLNISTDTALGGNSPSDEIVVSQKAIKTAVDAKYDASNPAGYTSNIGTVTSVNNVSPITGNVTLTASDVGAITDVKINNASVVTDGVANIPIGSSSKLGVYKAQASCGIDVYDGILYCSPAQEATIDRRNNGTAEGIEVNYQPITPYKLDYAVKKSITTSNQTLTTTEKTNACAWLGAAEASAIPTSISDLTDDTATTPIDKATTATKLGSSDVGSATQPIYLDDGNPTACTYSLGKSVPSDAVFTDTTYNAFVGADAVTAGSAGLVPAPAAGDQQKFLQGDGTWATIDALPSQSGQSGKFLTTDGTTASWATASGGSSTLSGLSDTSISSPSSGQLLKYNGSSWENATVTIPTTTDSITSGSSAALTSGGAYTNVVTEVAAHSTDSNKINVTKAGSTSTITIDNVSNATTATKVGSTTVGSSTTPIYLNNGTPTALSYTIAKSVPADAVFTDTTYSVFTGANGSTAGTSGLVKAPAATDNTKFLRGDCTWANVDTLPSQTSQSGKFLTTNGTTASWANIPTEIPSQSGQSGKYLTTNGTTASWASLTWTYDNSTETLTIS